MADVCVCEQLQAELHELHCIIDDHVNRGREEQEGAGVDYAARLFRFAQELADLRVLFNEKQAAKAAKESA